MKKRLILCLTTTLLVTSIVIADNAKKAYALTTLQSEFISSVEQGALEGYQTNHILPSLTIAQAILESGWGKSSLSSEGNNLFGIKAFNDWNGDSINLITQEYNIDSSSYTIVANFKVYPSVYSSIKDHTTLLSTERYRAVQCASNYKDACYAIYNCGYATSPNYPEQLIEVIENYNLQRYDEIATKSIENEYTLTKVETSKYDDSLYSVNGNNCADLFKTSGISDNDTNDSKANVLVISVK